MPQDPGLPLPPASQTLSPATRFLCALSEEISRTADEVAALGKIVLCDISANDRTARQCKMEAFALLTRKCALHAELLKISVRTIAHPSAATESDLVDAIAKISFAPVRERLSRSISMNATALARSEAAPMQSTAQAKLVARKQKSPDERPQGAPDNERANDILRLAQRLREYAGEGRFSPYSEKMVRIAQELDLHAVAPRVRAATA
jgi:hypothetical protein